MAVIATAAALIVVGATATRADGRVRRTTVRCCFELSVQAGGSQTVNYGDGTGAYPSFRGRYSATWKFAVRVLVKLVHAAGRDQLDYAAPYRFRTRRHLNVALRDWTVEWSFNDTPQGVEAACCFTQTPHGWTPACSVANASLGEANFTAQRHPVPRFGFSGRRLSVSLDRPAGRASFQCGLNDSRLDGVFPIEWNFNQLTRPARSRLLHGTNFAQSCSQTASFGPDGGISVVGSTGTRQTRARFRYFPLSRLYQTARGLDSLAGHPPPGFQGPASAPNTGLHCRAG